MALETGSDGKGEKETPPAQSFADSMKKAAGEGGDDAEVKRDDALTGDVDTGNASKALLEDAQADEKPAPKQEEPAETVDEPKDEKRDGTADDAQTGADNFRVGPPPGVVDESTEGKNQLYPDDRGQAQPDDAEARERGVAEDPDLKGRVEKGDEEAGDGKSDVTERTVEQIVEDAMGVKGKLEALKAHLEKFGEDYKKAREGDPDEAEFNKRMGVVLKDFEDGAFEIKPGEVPQFREDRRVIQEAIEAEEKKEEKDQDADRLKMLKAVERNLALAERAPGLMFQNVSLELYASGDVNPVEEGGKSRAYQMLEKATLLDPDLRYGQDPNFFTRAREIEKANGAPIQQDGLEISLKLQAIELHGRGQEVEMVPAGKELLGGREPIKEGDRPARPEEAGDGSDKRTLADVRESAFGNQEKVRRLGFHMDNFGKSLQEVKVGDPSPEEISKRMETALKEFQKAAEIVKPEDVVNYREDRRIIKEAIRLEQEKDEKEQDLEKLKILKQVERNLYVLERAPGLTYGNAALSLYSVGDVQPIEGEPYNGRSRASAMLEMAYINDPVLRYGKDPNFFNRAREIEKMNGVPLQQQSGDISRRLQEIEMRGFGDRIKLVPVAPEAELNLDIKPPKADGDEVPPKADGQEVPPKADGEEVPPKADGEEVPPKADGEEVPPKADGEEVPPKADGEEVPPKADGEEVPPKADGEEVPPKADEEEVPPRADGDDTPPKADGEDAPPKAQFSDAALARIAQSDPKVEIPEIEESPKRKSKLLRDTYGELSPSERAYVANQRYELLKSESGLTPRQALTGEVIAEFEQAIKDADAGVTPRSKELTEKIQAVNEQIVVFGDTQLKDIVWDRNGADDAAKKALPENLKGFGELTWNDARKQLNTNFEQFFNNEDLGLSADEKAKAGQFVKDLNGAITADEYNGVLRNLQGDETMKVLLENPSFRGMLQVHGQLTKPLLGLAGDKAALVQEYRQEFNQRALVRLTYANILKEVADDPSGEADRDSLVQRSRKQFIDAFANNVDEGFSATIARMAGDHEDDVKSNVQVKPTELLEAALNKNKEFDSGSADMAISIPLIAKSLPDLFKMEAGNLASDKDNVTPEERRQAFENLKPLMDRMITDADSATKPESNAKFEARFQYGAILYGGVGDAAAKEESAKMFTEAFSHATDANDGKVALEYALKAGANPNDLLKLALDGNTDLKEGESPKGMSLDLLARNVVVLYGKQVSEIAADKDNPTEAEKARALEIMRPQLERMVTLSDTVDPPQGDARFASRMQVGAILQENKDPKAKDYLSEAYALATRGDMAEAASELAIMAGAKPSDLIRGLYDQYDKYEAARAESPEKTNPISAEALQVETRRMINKQVESYKGLIDDKPASPAEINAKVLQDFAPQIEKLDGILDKEVEAASQRHAGWEKSLEDKFPQDEAAKAAAKELHAKLFGGDNRRENFEQIVFLMTGGDPARVNQDLLNNFVEWKKHISPNGDDGPVKDMLTIEADRDKENFLLEQAIGNRFDFDRFKAGKLALAGDNEKAKEVFEAAVEEVPEDLQKKLIDGNPDVASLKEILTGEVARPDFAAMSTAELQEHINSLSRSAVIRVKLKGVEESIEAESYDVLFEKTMPGTNRKINRGDIVPGSEESAWGSFDKTKAQENLAEYKLAYEELLRRADNPETTDGRPITREDARADIEKMNKSLADGKNYFKEGDPPLTNEERLFLDYSINKGLKLMTDPVTLRMEYAMHMETLGQRASAGIAYMEAQGMLEHIPTDLIEKQIEHLALEKRRFAGMIPPPELQIGDQKVPADTLLGLLKLQVEGKENYRDIVLDRDKGLNGDSIFIDPTRIGVRDLSVLYGLDDIKSAMAKRAAFFYLAPKFVQKEELGKPQWVWQSADYPQDGSKPQVMEKAALIDYVAKREGISPEEAANKISPYGDWTFGNTDAFKPDKSMDFLAQAISDHENISIEEARTRVQAHTADAVKMLVGAQKLETESIRQTIKDYEFATLYTHALENIEPSLREGIEREAGSNFWANAATTTAFMASMAGMTWLISRGRVKPNVGRPMVGSTLAKAGGALAVSTVVAAGTRHGVRYLQTGEHESASDTFWNTMGSVGVGLLANKMITAKAPGESMRLIPSSVERRLVVGAIKGSPEAIQPYMRSTFRFLASVGKPMSVNQSAEWLEKRIGQNGETGTVGHLMSLMDEAGHTLRTSQFAHALEVTDKTGRAILKDANLADYGKRAFLNEAAAGGNTIKSISDLRGYFTSKGMKAELSALDDAIKVAKLSADDLAKPITSTFGKRVLQETNLYGANLRDVAKEIHSRLVKGQTTDMTRLVDEMKPLLEAERSVVNAQKAADLFDDALNATKTGNAPVSLETLQGYLNTLGAEGRAVASQMTRMADDMGIQMTHGIKTAEGIAMIKELGLHGSDMARLISQHQGQALDDLARSFASSAGKSVDDMSILDLQRHLAGNGKMSVVTQLETAAKSLKIDTAVKLSSQEARQIIQASGLSRTPGILTSVDDAVVEFGKTLGPEATAADLKAALMAQGHKTATDLAKSIPKSFDDVAIDSIKLTSPEGKALISRLNLNYHPGILAADSQVRYAAAELTDDFAKAFADDAAEYTLNDFKAYYARNFGSKFDDAFPNLKDVPGKTLLSEVAKTHGRAFDGQGLMQVLSRMDDEAIKAISGSEERLVRRTTSVLSSGGKTAWGSAYQAVRHPIQTAATVTEAVVDAGRTVVNKEARTQALEALTSKVPTRSAVWQGTKSTTWNTLVGTKDAAVSGGRFFTDRLTIRGQNPEMTALQMYRQGDANAIYTYLAAKGFYQATAGAHQLREQTNPETGEAYSAMESLFAALDPGIIGESFDKQGWSALGDANFYQETGWNTLGSAFEVAFMVQLMKTGNLGKPSFGPHGLPKPTGYNPLTYLNRTRQASGLALDGSITRTWGRMKELSLESSVKGQIARSIGTGGAMLGGNQVFDGGVAAIRNLWNRHEFKTDMRVGPWSSEKLNYMNTEISNDDFKAPSNWEELFKSTYESVTGSGDGEPAKTKPEPADQPDASGTVIKSDSAPDISTEQQQGPAPDDEAKLKEGDAEEEEAKRRAVPPTDKKEDDAQPGSFRVEEPGR